MTIHRSVQDFLHDTEALLRERYADNNALLGVCEGLRQDPERERDVRFFSQAVDGVVVAAALRTPPHNLLITPSDPAHLDAFVEEIHGADPECPGVAGDRPTAAAFVAAWQRRSPNVVPRCLLEQGVYELTTLAPMPPATGVLRMADARDAAFVGDWAYQFAADAGLPTYEHDHARLRIGALLEMGRVALWCDPHPGSMAAFVPVDARASRVSYVYTPADLRGRGYASAVVWALSRKLLEGGNERCFLFTDLANPTSNAIYQRVGYRQVGEGALWRFDGAT